MSCHLPQKSELNYSRNLRTVSHSFTYLSVDIKMLGLS